MPDYTLNDSRQSHLDEHNNNIQPVVDAFAGTTPADFRAADDPFTAAETPFSPALGITSTNAQDAIVEAAVDAAAVATAHAALTGNTHGIGSGQTFESTAGSAAKVAAHAAASAAHAAANIAVTPTGSLAATNAQAAFAELVAEKVATAVLGQPGGVATLDGSGILAAPQRPAAGSAATFTSIGQYPVSTNSIPLGTNDARAALQSLADSLTGGGCIVVDRKVSMNMAASGSNAFGLRLPNNVWLQITPGASLELLPNQPFGAPPNGAVYAFIMNKDLATGKNVRIFGGGRIDCRAATHPALFTMHGIRFQGSDNCGVDGITIANVRGTGSSPQQNPGDPNETFFIQHYRSSNGWVRNNVVICDDAGETSTGISQDDAFHIDVERNLVEGMTEGHGYTNSRSRDIYYDHNAAYKNVGNGFNNEHPCGTISHKVSICGGLVGTPSNGGTMGRYALNEDIGNGTASYHGFVLLVREEDNGRGEIILDGCRSMHNKQGLTFSIAAAHALPVRILNSSFRFNDGFGIGDVSMSGSDISAQQALTRIEQSCIVQNNTGGQLKSPWAFAA